MTPDRSDGRAVASARRIGRHLAGSALAACASAWTIGAILLCVHPGASAQPTCATVPTAGFTATCSTSRAEVFADTLVRETTQTYSTRLLALLDGTTTVYDQTFAAAFGTPALDAALVAAQAALAAAGLPDPVVVGVPVLASSGTAVIGSIVGAPVVTGTTQSSTTSAGITVGPGTLLIGDLGLCTGTGPIFTTSPDSGFGVPTNCSGGSPQTFAVIQGEINTNTNVNTLTTISRTITTTDTLLTTALYTLTGTTQRSTSVPEPGTLALASLALPALALARRRTIGRPSAPRFAG